MIVANAVCVIYGVSADVVFLPLYALELLLKLYGYGWQPFIRSKWNMCVVAELRVAWRGLPNRAVARATSRLFRRCSYDALVILSSSIAAIIAAVRPVGAPPARGRGCTVSAGGP